MPSNMNSSTVIDLSQDDDNAVAMNPTARNRDSGDNESIGYASDEAVASGYCPSAERFQQEARARRTSRRRLSTLGQPRALMTATTTTTDPPQPRLGGGEQPSQPVDQSARQETAPTQPATISHEVHPETVSALAASTRQLQSADRMAEIQRGLRLSLMSLFGAPYLQALDAASPSRQRQQILLARQIAERRDRVVANRTVTTTTSQWDRTLALREERRRRRGLVDPPSPSRRPTTNSADPFVKCPTLAELVHDKEVNDDGCGPVCIICHANMPLCVALPCLHMSYCVACARSMCCDEHGRANKLRVECAKCRQPIQAVSRVFAE
eukprot:scaffold1751_cov253-Amphora_coffeaeformis.AAC.4